MFLFNVYPAITTLNIKLNETVIESWLTSGKMKDSYYFSTISNILLYYIIKSTQHLRTFVSNERVAFLIYFGDSENFKKSIFLTI